MIVVETLLTRWYAFGFLAVFIWAALAERDIKRVLRFLAIAFAIEFTAEFASTHWGIPFGRYDYIAGTQGDELYLSNIPLFVPVTFGVVVWAGRSLAQAGFGARSAGPTIMLGALLAMVLDLIIDPMTLRGRSWFLGPLYAFEGGGGWFGVPWTNAGGWLLVSGLVLWVDELFDAGRARVIDPLRGPTLAALIVLFFVALALFTAHWGIVLAQVVIAGALWIITAANIREAIGEADGPADPEAEPA